MNFCQNTRMWSCGQHHVCQQGSISDLKMEGMLALLVKLEPKLYRKFLGVENERSTMYVKLKKALYGTLQAAMIFGRH